MLDYVAGRLEGKQTLAQYLARASRGEASHRLHPEPFFIRSDDLRRKPGDKPLAVVFETIDCSPCDELHREGLQRSEVRALVGEFDVARFSLAASTPLTSPAGRATTAQAWARELGVTYTPTIVFFDRSGMEVFRIDAYLRPFHLAGALAYVSSRAYRSEPSFQRFMKTRAERLSREGRAVDLWK